MPELLTDDVVRASREFVRGEIIAAGRSREDADAWCDAWEAEARRLGIDSHIRDYWTIGSVWIREQRGLKRAPAA